MMACLPGKTFLNFCFPLYQTNFLAPQVICTLTKHLNLLDLYINYDITSSCNKKFEKLKDDCTVCFQNQAFNST